MSTQQQLHNIVESIDTESKNPRLLMVLPASAGDVFLSTSLFSSIKELYPEYDLYFACQPQFQHILKHNPYIYKTINYQPIMNDALAMEGRSNWNGLFDICLQLNTLTQLHISYHHNGKDRSVFFRKNQ